MNQKILSSASLTIIFSIAYAMFDGVEGKWIGQLPLGNGRTYPLSYTFYTDSGKLTGFNQSDGDTTALTDGKMYGDSISFMLDAMGSKMLHTGKYFAVGDSIGLNITINGKVFHGTLRRSDSK